MYLLVVLCMLSTVAQFVHGCPLGKTITSITVNRDNSISVECSKRHYPVCPDICTWTNTSCEEEAKKRHLKKEQLVMTNLTYADPSGTGRKSIYRRCCTSCHLNVTSYHSIEWKPNLLFKNEDKLVISAHAIPCPTKHLIIRDIRLKSVKSVNHFVNFDPDDEPSMIPGVVDEDWGDEPGDDFDPFAQFESPGTILKAPQNNPVTQKPQNNAVTQKPQNNPVTQKPQNNPATQKPQNNPGTNPKPSWIVPGSLTILDLGDIEDRDGPSLNQMGDYGAGDFGDPDHNPWDVPEPFLGDPIFKPKPSTSQNNPQTNPKPSQSQPAQKPQNNPGSFPGLTHTIVIQAGCVNYSSSFESHVICRSPKDPDKIVVDGIELALEIALPVALGVGIPVSLLQTAVASGCTYKTYTNTAQSCGGTFTSILGSDPVACCLSCQSSASSGCVFDVATTYCVLCATGVSPPGTSLLSYTYYP